jgi:predicted nucleic acid-binding protein
VVLVDTSVLIGFFKGQVDEKAVLFKDVLSRDIPFGISSYTYQEVLQGARNEAEFNTLKEYLSTQQIYYLETEASTFEKAARIYFDLMSNYIPELTVLNSL